MKIRDVALIITGISILIIISTPKIPERVPVMEPIPEGKTPRGFDYQRTDINTYHYYTDEEIRAIRDANPGYIIKVPGRRILSKEAEFEERIEEYLENNPDALDEYRN